MVTHRHHNDQIVNVQIRNLLSGSFLDYDPGLFLKSAEAQRRRHAGWITTLD
jgi:hypothetical protein